ncbi:MAG: putative transcriptional regulator of viral defense system [Planctomycetaceae bacterium]|jgi:predicted transcriptional regulator of viral defense system
MVENTTQQDRLIEFLEQNTLARSKELQAIGVAATTISRAVKQGSVERIGRGLYQLSDSEVGTNAILAEVSKQAPKARICLMSALAFHGLTVQMPRKVWIAIGVSNWQPSFKHSKTRVVRFREPYYSEGVEQHKISGTTVSVYSIEKTICDAFRLPKLVDRSVAIECLKVALTDRKLTPAKIASAAKKYRAWNQIQPYLEAITAKG